MIILLRGHIRRSFGSDRLYHFIRNLCKYNKDVEIYIHTWNIIQSNVSWRPVEKKEIVITMDLVNQYFRDCAPFIKKIIIDDDNLIKLNGNTIGIIPGTQCPIIGWKNYWYGQYQIMNYIYSNFSDKDKKRVIINLRFDIFINPHGFIERDIVNFINKNKQNHLTENKFLYDKFFVGCDNCFIGNIDTMHNLIERFHFHLDSILSKFKIIKHQEGLVMIENSILFNSNNKITIKDVVSYGDRHQKLRTLHFANYSMQKIN